MSSAILLNEALHFGVHSSSKLGPTFKTKEDWLVVGRHLNVMITAKIMVTLKTALTVTVCAIVVVGTGVILCPV